MRKFQNFVFLASGTILLLAPPVNAQTGESKTAEQVYKNITELKGIPADQLGPAMQFISASLGVECSFCHVQGKMESDDKREKKSAREMIAMTNAINKQSFGGRNQVTCNTCHRGSTRPVSIPSVLETDPAPRAVTAAPPPNTGAAPTADDIVQKYIAAVGGADAIKSVTSRTMKGVIVVANTQTPIDVFTKAPNKRVTITHSTNGDSFTAFDGTAGWMGNTGRPAREMSAAESGASSLDAEFYFPLRVKEMFTQLRRGRPETINSFECEVLTGSGAGRPPVRLYFEKTSGLLLRMVRYAETPLGRIPTQIDYSDYSVVDGVKIPRRWTLSRTNGRFTIQITDVKSNVSIDDAKFAKPSGDVK